MGFDLTMWAVTAIEQNKEAKAPEVTQTTMESDRSCCQPFPQPNTSNCTIDCSLGFLACCGGKEGKRQGEGEGQRRREGRPQFGFGRKLTHQPRTLVYCVEQQTSSRQG